MASSLKLISSALTANSQVSEEEPAGDEGFLGVAWGFTHDVQIGWVEAKGCSRETVCHQVNPQQLHRDQSLRESQSRSQENAASVTQKEF